MVYSKNEFKKALGLEKPANGGKKLRNLPPNLKVSLF